MTGFRAGAGRSPIDLPSDLWPLEGFTRVADPLFVRVVILDSGRRVVWAVLDLTSLMGDALEGVRARLASVAGVEPDAVLVSVSHTFSAPHLAASGGVRHPDAARLRAAESAVFAAVDAAAARAVCTIRPATLATGDGVCDVNVNRDVEGPGGWTLGRSELGFSDKTVSVVRVNDIGGRVIALLVNAAVQPSVMHGSRGPDGGLVVTADLAGAATASLELAYPGAVAMFVIGAAGDQSPALTSVRRMTDPDGTPRIVDVGSSGTVVADLLGERLGAAAALITDSLTDFDDEPQIVLTSGLLSVDGQVPTPRELIRPTRAHEYITAGERDLPYWLLQLGDTAVVGVQTELSAATGQRIRDRSPSAHTLVATLMNGGAKYLPEASAFDAFTYEALSSFYARGTAERLTDGVVEHLHRLQPAPSGGAER